jgi:hypothetical protein
MKAKDIVGTWQLVSYSCKDESGNISYPLGENAVGYIMYTNDGYMSVSMASKNRPKRSSGDLTGGTKEEKIAEAETYITYCGTYEFYEDRVVHNIEMALFPNRVGSSQVRYYRIKGSRIILTTPPISIDNKPQVCTVIWERPSSQ